MRVNDVGGRHPAPKMLVAVWLVGDLRIFALTKGTTVPSALMIS